MIETFQIWERIGYGDSCMIVRVENGIVFYSIKTPCGVIYSPCEEEIFIKLWKKKK